MDVISPQTHVFTVHTQRSHVHTLQPPATTYTSDTKSVPNGFQLSSQPAASFLIPIRFRSDLFRCSPETRRCRVVSMEWAAVVSPEARKIGWKCGKEREKKTHLCKLHLIAPLRFQARRAVVLSGWNVNTAISIFIHDCQTSRELIRRRRRWDRIMKEGRRWGGGGRGGEIGLKYPLFFPHPAWAHDLLSVWVRYSKRNRSIVNGNTTNTQVCF